MKWKMKVKGALALLLAVIMMLPPNLSALANGEIQEAPGDWETSNDAVTVSGDAENGYDIHMDKNAESSASALYTSPVDFTQKAMKFRFGPEENEWTYVYFRSQSEGKPEIAGDGGSQGSHANIESWGGQLGEKHMTLRFARIGGNLEVSLWNGPVTWGEPYYWFATLGTIEAFSWESEHTLGFVQDEETGNWYVQIDGMTLDSSDAAYDAQSYLNVNLNHYKTDGGAYIEIGNYNDQRVLFDAVKFVSNKMEVSTDWETSSEAVTVDGNAENGYILHVNENSEGSGSALYKTSVDFTQKAMTFRFCPEENEWAYVYFRSQSEGKPDITGDGGSQGSHANIESWGGQLGEKHMTLRFARIGGSLEVSLWNGPVTWGPDWYWFETLGTMEDFAWESEHTLGFVQDEETGNWYVQIDGVTLDSFGAAHDAQSYLNVNLNHYKTDGGAYIMIGAYANGGQKTLFDTVRFIEKKTDPPVGPTEDWAVNNSSVVRITGDAENGYIFAVDKTQPGSGSALYKTPVDFGTQAIRFTYNPADTEWTYIDFRTAGGAVPDAATEHEVIENWGGQHDGSSKMTLRFDRVGDALKVCYWYGWTDVSRTLGTVNDFDWTKEHTLSFVQDKNDNNWYMQIDDTVLTSVAGNDTQGYINANLNTYREKGGAYIRIGARGKDDEQRTLFDTVKFVKKSSDTPDITVGDWDISNKGMVAVEGDAEAGYTFEVDKSQEGSSSVLYRTPIDLGKQAIRFAYAPENGNWSYMHLKLAAMGLPKAADDHAQIESWGGQHDGSSQMTLRFDRDGDNLKVAYWFGWAPEEEPGIYAVLGTIQDFDWTKEHTMSFIQDQENFGWNIKIDDTVLNQQNGEEAQSWFNVNLNNYQQAGGVYIRIGARGANGQKTLFDTVKFVKNTENDTEKPITSEDWNCTNVVAIGDRKNGYRLAGQAGLGTAYYKKRMRPGQTEIEFRVNVPAGWGYISLSEDPDMAILASNNELKEKNGMIILLERKETLLNLQLYAKDTVISLASYEDFDFSAKHTISFVRELGSWYMVFDGEVIRSYRLNDYLFEQLVSVNDGLYYRFSSYFAPFTFEDVRFKETAGADLNTEYDWEIVGYDPTEGTSDNLLLKGVGAASYKRKVDLNNTTIRAQLKPEMGGWQAIQFGNIMSSSSQVYSVLTTPEKGMITLLFGRQENGYCRVSLFGKTADGSENEVLIGYIAAFDWDAVHDIRLVNQSGRWYVAVDNQSFAYVMYSEDSYITDSLSGVLNGLNGQVYVRFSDCWILKDNTWGSLGFVEGVYRAPAVDCWPTMKAEKTGNGWTLSGEGTAGFTSRFDFEKDALKFQTKPELDTWTGITFGNIYGSGLSLLQGPDNPYDMITLLFARNSERMLRLSLFDGENEIALMYIDDFDFDAEHTLSFVKRKGNWYLNIDGRTIEGLNRDTDGVAAKWLRTATKRLAGGAYIRIGTPGSMLQTIKGVDIVNKTEKNFEIPEAPKRITKAEPEKEPEKKPEDKEPVVQPEPEPEQAEESGIHMTVVLSVLGVLAALAVGAVVILLVLGRKKKKEDSEK